MNRRGINSAPCVCACVCACVRVCACVCVDGVTVVYSVLVHSVQILVVQTTFQFSERNTETCFSG